MRAIAGIVPAPRLLPVLVDDLALGNLFQGHRQVVLRARLDERRRKVVEGALAELVVVVVDLPGPLRSDDHERVARVDVVEQVVDAWMNHCRAIVPAFANSSSTIRIRRSVAASTSSFGTM